MDKRKNTVYLGLGSNLGDRMINLRAAIRELETLSIDLLQYSSVYESEPWGADSLHIFLNMVLEIETELSPIDLLHACQLIEQNLGRKKKTKDRYENRIIDIDILSYADLVYTSGDLKLPHPEIAKRNFVLIPWQEIANDFIVSGLEIKIEELLKNCEDQQQCHFYSAINLNR